MAKTFSTFFFSLSFVCIGMDTRLKDIISKENRNALKAFLGAQIFNIIVTCIIAWLMFGIVKPAVWPEHRHDKVVVTNEISKGITPNIASPETMLPAPPAVTERGYEVMNYTTVVGESNTE